MKNDKTIYWIIGIVIIIFLVGNQFGLFSTFSPIAYPLPDNGQDIHFVSVLSLFTTYLQGESSCGDMSDAGCSPGWEPQCFVNDCDNCGSHTVGGVTECSTCYFCVEVEDTGPTCPSNAPYYCDRTGLCYSKPGRCECETKTCPSTCINKILSYNGLCSYEGDGNCAYQTSSVECCLDADCGFGLLCSGNKCVQPSVSGENLGFEEWSTTSSPSYWDISSSYFSVNRTSDMTEGNFALGLSTVEGTFYASSACLQYVQASQQIDLTNIDEFKFDSAYCMGSWAGYMCCGKETSCAPNDGTRGSFKTKMYIGNDEYHIPQDFQTTTIDVSSYTGLNTIRFYLGFCPASDGSKGIGGGTMQKVDNIRLVSSYLTLLETELQKQIVLVEELEGNLIAQAQLILELTLNLEQQGGIVNNLEASIEEKAIIIQSLTTNIEDQNTLISQLELNLDEKTQLVNSLELNIQEQAITILALTSQAEEQAVIIDNLALTISQQAFLIDEMELTVFQQAIIIDDLNLNIQQQAQIIDNLNLNLQQKIELISQLEITTQEQLDLINQMTLSFSEQQEIIDSLSRIIGEDVDYILELELTVSQSADYINSLELTIAQQSDLISQLNLTLQQQTALIKQLELNNEETAQLISNLNLQISDQAEMIKSLNLELSDDAEIISNLNLKLSEEAELINALHLTIDEQIELISQLELSMAEEKELISKLYLTIEEQQKILDGLVEKPTGFDLNRFMFNIGDFEVKLWMLIVSGLLFLLLITGGKKK